MTLARGNHVLLTREHAAHRLASLLGSECEDRRELDTAGFFTTKSTTETLDFDDDFVVVDAEDPRRISLPNEESVNSIDPT